MRSLLAVTPKHLLPLLLTLTKRTTNSLSMSASTLIVDSHLHVWADATTESTKYPYAEGQIPPDSLKTRARTSSLLTEMKNAGVDGALIVQPINHKFDHSYVEDAVSAHPGKFKGMLLHDPSLTSEMAVSRLEELALKGFVGVRFNPYLWPEGVKMSKDGGAGMAVYRRCGELKMPVGVMAFKGLGLHYDDVVSLIDACPETTLIFDHFGFTRLDEDGDEAFKKLLSLSKHKNVVVKISAVFRIAEGKDFEEVRTKRFLPLLEAFGAERLMFGTDFPFVLEQDGGYKHAVDLVGSWAVKESDRESLMGGTAQRLFGFWGETEEQASS